jgi:hypothetical protein
MSLKTLLVLIDMQMKTARLILFSKRHRVLLHHRPPGAGHLK